MAGLTLDSGALIAYERTDARARRYLELAFAREVVPVVPAPVVVEVWRGGPRAARTARLLGACVVEPLDEGLARRAGELLATVGGTPIDACVVVSAARRGDRVLTSDPGDLDALAARLPAPRPVIVPVAAPR